ncbi:MAG TPA: PAS domain S-box protein [Candidatus Acidoferrales bacterium]|jgi:PAS domain S-box-containing protein|nr:PAS domain S-box protein [Candidatus Acidoferrales bacterium]
MGKAVTRYILAVVAAALALILRNLLTPLLGHQNPYHTVWLAVAFSAWYCGLGPSILTTVLTVVGVDYWFLPPVGSFAVADRTDWYGMFAFVIFSGAIIALGESNRRGFAARSRLAAIVESSEDAIVSKNLNGVITSWNKGAERVFGYTAAEAVGQNITMIIPIDHRHEETVILGRIRRGEPVEHFETVRVRKDGSLVDVSLAISPIRDSTGRVIGASKVARDVTERKRVEEAIREAEVAARLLRLQDEERRRMARELHDGVGQLLAAMNMNAAGLEMEKANLSPEGVRAVDENARMIEQVSSDIRTLSYLFHPPMLDEMGLPSALAWYVDGFAERSKIAAKLEVPTEWERLPEDYELCLFRIAQECLTNIHRHSGSPTAAVKLLRTPAEITLEVSDEGKGMDPEIQARVASGKTAGVGLRGMRERLSQFGGNVEIRSNDRGTAVIATLPFVESAESASSR